MSRLQEGVPACQRGQAFREAICGCQWHLFADGMRGKHLTVLLLLLGHPPLSQRETPRLVIIRAHAQLDCKKKNNYYYIINIIRIRIRVSPQGNQRSRKIVLCGTTNLCQGQRRGSPPLLGLCQRKEAEEAEEGLCSPSARGSTARSRAARAPGSVGGCSAGSGTEVPEVLASERGLSRGPQGVGSCVPTNKATEE